MRSPSMHLISALRMPLFRNLKVRSNACLILHRIVRSISLHPFLTSFETSEVSCFYLLSTISHYAAVYGSRAKSYSYMLVMQTFFTSDTHFDDQYAIQYFNRPF